MSEGVRIMLALFAPLVCGFLTLLVPRGLSLVRTLVALVGPVLAFVLLMPFVGRASPGAFVLPFIPDLGIDFAFRLDELGLFFALLVSGIGALIVPYAHAYFRGDDTGIARLHPPLGVFATAMLGVALSDSMFGLFVFWELTTVSSFLLIGWNRSDPNAVRSALQACVITGTGGLALLLGFAVLGIEGGAWRFSELDVSTMEPWALTLAVAMLGVGAATKSAQFPLHSWLPGAMAAPTPVSAYLHSATMVKAGVFLLGRALPLLDGVDLWVWLLVPLGSLTMAHAAVQALRSATVKRLLAFTTVSQLGLFVCMYGLGGVSEDAIKWPVTQILNHALYKAPLFMLAGALAVHAGVKTVAQLDGLARRSPMMGWLLIIGLYAMAAGPATLSFEAKELFVLSALKATKVSWVGWVAIGGVVIAAVCNCAVLVRLGRRVFAKTDNDTPVLAGSAWMWWPAALLLLVQVVAGSVPGVMAPIEAVETHAYKHLHGTWGLLKPTLELGISLGALALGVVVGLSPLLRRMGMEPCDHLFRTVHRWVELLAHTVASLLQSGSIRRYLMVSILALGAALIWVMLGDDRWFTFPALVPLNTAPFVTIVLGVLTAVYVIACAVALPLTRSRLVRILVLGSLGFGVTLMFLVNRAPDLALTQIMFEIISVIMFLLVMRLLPEKTRADRERPQLSRAVFALVMGALVGWTVLHAASVPDGERIARAQGEQTPERLGAWFLEHSYKGSAESLGRGGGGDNVVNVILVDFRGYDTMGEIAVLAIAMLAVLAMLGPRRLRPAARLGEARVPGVSYMPQVSLVSPMLRTGVRAIFPLVLIFAAYVFFKGHQLPGGGFIAGLIASVGCVVYRMTEGRQALRRLIPLRPGVVIGVGLVLAMVTGFVPMILPALGFDRAYPFLTSDHGYLEWLGNFHLTSVLFFDLGVFIVVVGASVGMINRLEEELE